MTSVFEKRQELIQPVSVGFPKVLSTTPPLTPVPEGSVIGAVFRQENNIASLINRSTNGLNVGDDIPGFDPLPYVPQQFFNYADRYIGLRNVEQVNRMTDILRDEFNDKAIIAANPYRSLVYGAVSGVLDFPGLLMPGGVLYSEYKLGASIAKSALSVGIASLVAGTIDETILYNSQYTRSVQESVNNVAMRTILGSVLGGAGGYFASRYGRKVVDAATKEASDIYANGNPTYLIEATDGGFKVTKQLPAPTPKDTPPRSKTNMEQGDSWRASGDGESNVPTRLNQDIPAGEYPGTEYNPKYEDVFTTPDSFNNPMFTDQVFDESARISGLPQQLKYGLQHNPMMRLKVSDFDSAAFVSDMLFDSRLGTIATDEKGIAKPTNLQGLLYSNYWKFNSALLNIQDIFYKQKGDIWETIKRAERAAGLSADEFSTELAYYIRNPGITAPNKDVAKAVDIAVNQILNPMREWAVSIGKLQDWQEIEGYLMRVWNREYVVENQDQLTQLLYGYYKEVNETLKDVLPKIENINKAIEFVTKGLETETNPKTIEQMKLYLAQLQEMLKTLNVQDIYGTKANHLVYEDGTYRKIKSDKELLADANESLSNILSYGDDALDSMLLSRVLPTSAKPLKSRKILIHDNLLGNFIKQDAFEVLSRYIKVMNPLLTSTQFAKQFGVENLEQVGGIFKKTVRDEYLSKSIGASPKESRRLEKHLDKILDDIDASIEIIMNVYGGGKNDDAWYVEYLQKFRTFNTFRLMGSMTLASLTDIGTMSLTHGPFKVIYEGILPLLKSKELRKIVKEELRAIGWALNHQNGQLIKSAADTGSLVVQPNKFSGIIDRALQGFGDITLINQWSNIVEMISGTVSTNNILGAIEASVKGETLSPRTTKWLNRLGIGKEHYQAIYDLWQKNGGTLDGVRYSNHQKWRLTTPEEAAAFNAFRIALTKDMRHMLVRPGPETKPKAMYFELGKTILQFKSYFFAATDKVLMSSIQDRKDMETWVGIMILLSIGALQYVITSLTHDREPDLSLNNLAKEAIDRTGILGIYAEYFNIFAKLNLIPGLGTTRYYTRGIAGAFGGPTIGALDDFATVMGKINLSITEGRELTAKDYAVMLRLMPYQNLFYTRKLSRQLLGIEEFKNPAAPIESTVFNKRSNAELNPIPRSRE
jgi:hypothetical protein